MRVDERRLPLHGCPQAHVVAMMRIGAAIAIAKEAAVDEPVVVRALPVLDRRGGRDGEGQLRQDGWLEDALRSNQGTLTPSKSKPRSRTARGMEASPKRRRCSVRKSKARRRTAASRSSVIEGMHELSHRADPRQVARHSCRRLDLRRT